MTKNKFLDYIEEKNGAKVIKIPGKNDKVDLINAIKYLGSQNITSVLVEGGSIVEHISHIHVTYSL